MNANVATGIRTPPGCPPLPAADESLFRHSDDTTWLDAQADPIRRVTEIMQAMGAVAFGEGAGEPCGSMVTFGEAILPNLFVSPRACQGRVFAAVTYDAARRVYNNRDFSSRGYEEVLGQWGRTLNVLDPPEHTKYRMTVQPGFGPEAVVRYEDELIRPIVSRRIAALKPKGRADLVRELTGFNAYEINGAVIGFPVDDIEYVAACFSRVFRANVDPSAFVEGRAAIQAYAATLIEGKRRRSGDDVISHLLQARVDGAPMREDRLVSMVMLLLAGGIDTVFKQSGTAIRLLLEHPDVHRMLRDDPSLVPRFVEEVLRYEGVASMLARQAAVDTQIAGVAIPAGAIVFVPQAVVNRDPNRWPDPHRFDLLREQKPNMAFAGGHHHCIGAGVARSTLKVLTETIIRELPGLRFDPERPAAPITGWTQRACLSLPAVWDADWRPRSHTTEMQHGS